MRGLKWNWLRFCEFQGMNARYADKKSVNLFEKSEEIINAEIMGVFRNGIE